MQSSRRKGMIAVAVVVTTFAGVGGSTAFADKGGGGGGNLKCFAGAPATCTVNPSSASVTLDTSSGGYAGAYYANSRAANTPLNAIDYSFTYTCDPGDNTTTCVGGGSPRWSIPIDTTGDSRAEGYAFLDAAGCGSTGAVSTTDPNCQVTFNNVTYPNWDAFAAANPTYTIGKELPFVITDTTEPGTTLISNITVTK